MHTGNIPIEARFGESARAQTSLPALGSGLLSLLSFLASLSVLMLLLGGLALFRIWLWAGDGARAALQHAAAGIL